LNFYSCLNIINIYEVIGADFFDQKVGVKVWVEHSLQTLRKKFLKVLVEVPKASNEDSK